VSDRNALADSVTSARFPSVRLRRGYAMGDVDAFLDRTAAAADPGPSRGAPASAAAVVAGSPSAISPSDGETGSPARVVTVVVTIATYGVVAGIVALVVRNVRPETWLPVWPTVLVGCGVGLVYEVVATLLRARRR